MSCVTNKPSLTCSQEKLIYLSKRYWETKAIFSPACPSLFTVFIVSRSSYVDHKNAKSIVITSLDSIDDTDPQSLLETSSNMLRRGKFLCRHDEIQS
jgi:hypothetical protein